MAKTDPPVLSLENICKKYELGGQTLYALCQVNAQIFAGEFVAIIGPSGSGKSTFLHIASMLDHPTSGKVYVNGIETTSFDEPKRAKLRNQEIGFIFQQFNLLPKTSAIDNVSLPLIYANVPESIRQQKAVEILTKVGLHDRLLNTPAQLSGGQQQRVAIARALINNPSIIFADEPTGNLDSASGKEIISMIISLNREGRTIVLVTHDPAIAKIAPRIINLKDGKIVSDRTK